MKPFSKALTPAQSKGACAAVGALSALSFVLGQEGYAGLSDLPASSASYLWCALALCFAWLFYQVRFERKLRLTLPAALMGLAFGVCNAFGGLLFAYDSWAGLARPTAMALALARAAGQALPMTALLTALHELLTREARPEAGARPGAKVAQWAGADGGLDPAAAANPARVKNDGAAGWRRGACKKLSQALQRRPLLSSMALLILCWSPFLIAYFPGTVCWDLGEMAAQYFGLREMTTWHPVFLTWIFGGLVQLGRWLGSENLGPALFTLAQTLCLSYALSRSLLRMKRLNAPRTLRRFAAAFFAFTPFFGGYAQFISKDTLYASFLLLFTLSVIEVVLSREEKAPLTCKTLGGLFGWGLLACLCRSNGLYVVLPTAVGLFLWGGRGRNRLSLLVALGGAIAAALLFSGALLPALGIKDETASGIYSVCFQQSARVLRDHGKEVTPEEYAEIDRVLDAKRLPQLYEPTISDPVKYTFRYYGQGAQAEKEALRRYEKVWLSMLKKYPLTYAEAFFAGNTGYYVLIPKIEGESYNNQAGNRLVFETFDVGKADGYLHTQQPEGLEGLRRLLAIYARGWRRLPLLSLTYCCAVYTWLLAGVGLSLARQRRWRRLLAFGPALLSLGVCLLSPVNDYFRYFLPIVLMTFPLLALGFFSGKEKNIGEPAE